MPGVAGGTLSRAANAPGQARAPLTLTTHFSSNSGFRLASPMASVIVVPAVTAVSCGHGPGTTEVASVAAYASGFPERPSVHARNTRAGSAETSFAVPSPGGMRYDTGPQFVGAVVTIRGGDGTGSAPTRLRATTRCDQLKCTPGKRAKSYQLT